MTSDGPRPSAPRKKAAPAGGAAALSEVIAKVKAGQLGARVDARKAGDLAPVAEELNALLAHVQERLVEADRRKEQTVQVVDQALGR